MCVWVYRNLFLRNFTTVQYLGVNILRDGVFIIIFFFLVFHSITLDENVQSML